MKGSLPAKFGAILAQETVEFLLVHLEIFIPSLPGQLHKFWKLQFRFYGSVNKKKKKKKP